MCAGVRECVWVCESVQGGCECAGVCVSVCMGVRGCVQVWEGVHGYAWVCAGMRGCAQVCVDMGCIFRISSRE